jgi:redox-sensitive bicupin YhaK (pirin superfamily)
MPASVEYLIKPHVRDLGGFSVRRLLPSFAKQMVGPFIFLDHLGVTEFPPGQGIDVRPHPHIGLATVTYLFEGTIMHRDSLGSHQLIQPGDVNWMTAGCGIVHSERTPPDIRAAGSRGHGLQTWVALPRAFEQIEPSFFHHPAPALPVIEQDGVQMRVVAGHAFGQRSPVETFSDTLYVAVTMEPGSQLTLPAEHEERAVYVLQGDVSIDGETIAAEHLAVLTQGNEKEIFAHSAARLMLLGGEKADGQRFIWWNFVASSRERIERAKQDWLAQRMGKVADDSEFTPLPDK